jgi:aryl-alcohol dehydrogenase-like predicted oxidoreductase
VESRLARGSYDYQNFTPKYLREALEASLRRLQTDFVDLYQLHGPREVVHEDVVALMTDLQSEGKIRGFGVGLESLGHADQWVQTGLLSAIQVPFGLLDPEAGEHVIPQAATMGIPVVVRGVFASGFLVRRRRDDLSQLRPGQPARLAALYDFASSVGVSPLQLAMWFVVARPGISAVLIGTSSPAHLSEAARYFETPPMEDVLLNMHTWVATRGQGPADAGRVCGGYRQRSSRRNGRSPVSP